jgi:hypothetical protein
MNATLCILALSFIGSAQRGPDRAPAVGAVAPPVVAEALDAKAPFDLAGNKGKRPTVLLFGSCT